MSFCPGVWFGFVQGLSMDEQVHTPNKSYHLSGAGKQSLGTLPSIVEGSLYLTDLENTLVKNVTLVKGDLVLCECSQVSFDRLYEVGGSVVMLGTNAGVNLQDLSINYTSKNYSSVVLSNSTDGAWLNNCKVYRTFVMNSPTGAGRVPIGFSMTGCHLEDGPGNGVDHSGFLSLRCEDTSADFKELLSADIYQVMDLLGKYSTKTFHAYVDLLSVKIKGELNDEPFFAR